MEKITGAPKRILLRMCRMSGREMDFIAKAVADEWVVPLGPDVNAFEDELKSFLDAPGRVVALSAGTAALHLALIECGVGPGDEVMVQSFTFAATANPVRYLGAVPVFVDSEPETWNMDPDLLDRAIAARLEITGRLPKAIIPCYLYGMPARISEIMAVAGKWGIPVVEDSAEAFGSRYEGQACGTFGRFGVLSFNGNKMITTSGGGALVCRDPEDAAHVLFLATQARENLPYYEHEELGYNYRLSNISACIGRGQMMVAEAYLAHHRHRHEFYRRELAGIPGVTLHDNPSPQFDSNFWLSTVLLDPALRIRGQEEAYSGARVSGVGMSGGLGSGRGCTHDHGSRPADNVEALRVAMAREAIETRPLWKPMHLQPLYADAPAYVNGVSATLFASGLCLPSGPWVTDADARRVVGVLRDSIIG